MSLIYKPGGAALEYARWAANLRVGCVHGCTYCYVPGIFRQPRDEFNAAARPKGGDDGAHILEQFKKEARALKEAGCDHPILLYFTSDPFQPVEAQDHLTRRALEILSLNGLRAVLLTKGKWMAFHDFAVIKKGRHIFGATLTGRRAKEWEPGAAPNQSRVKILRLAKDMGIRTWASIEPVIYHLDSLEAIREAAAHVDHFAIGKMNHFNPPQPIDWRAFKADAEKLLKGLGYHPVSMEEGWHKPAGTYYLKRALLEAAK